MISINLMRVSDPKVVHCDETTETQNPDHNENFLH